MINAISRWITGLVEKFIPDAFVFALFLTVGAFSLALLQTEHSFFTLINFWGDGFWNLLSFAMQMVLILILGMTFARTKWVLSFVEFFVLLAKSERQAALIITLCSSLFCWLNWGLGLVLGGILTQKMVQKFPRLRFGTVLGLSYGGFLVWHGGLSGSIPLKMSAGGAILQSLGLGSIPTEKTLFSQTNLTLTGLTLIILFLVALFIPVKGNKDYQIAIEKDEEEEIKAKTPSEKWERSFWVVLIPVLLIFSYVGSSLVKSGLTLNLVNLILLGLALLFHGSVHHFLKSFTQNLSSASGIIVSFPFYAGIMGLIATSGLGEKITTWILASANETTFYPLSYLSAGLLNFFVPSGGGQWIVQGPITLKAALKMGMDIPTTALAIAWGDAWTNMIQPFWAIPLLSIAGLKLKDIMPICLFLFFITGLVTSLYFFSLGLA